MSRFNNKNAIITGGSSGIGHAIYKRLLSEGANVVVWDILSLKDQYNSENSLFINVDVTRWADIENALEKSINFLKKLDILICSAGITGPNKKTWEYTEKEWEYVFDVNTKGTISLISRAESLGIVLKTLEEKVGSMKILPIASFEGEPCSRIIVSGKLGSKGNLSLSSPLVMHMKSQGKGKRFVFTKLARDILYEGKSIRASLT